MSTIRCRNLADGVGSWQRGPRTHPAHVESRLVYIGADRDVENRNPSLSDLELLKNMSTQNTGVKLPTAATNAQLAGTEGLG